MTAALAIGLQGIGYGPLLVAVQGFAQLPVRDRANGGGVRYSDEDIRALVEAKWEAIEAGRRVQEAPVPSTRPAPRVEKTAEIEQVAPVRAIEAKLPGAAPVVSAPLLPDAAERAREARRRNDEEALILMLAELL